MKIVLKEYPKLFKSSSPVLEPNVLHKKVYLREKLASALFAYNDSIGNDAFAKENIQAFKDKSACCVFSGQQLGFMGGPAYTILKAISCLALAKRQGAVPIFWLATEDHDIDEIDHACLLNSQGNLEKHRLLFQKKGGFVEDLVLGDEQKQEIKNFLFLVGEGDFFQEIASENSYAKAMAKVLVKLFCGTGLVFLEPRLLRPFAVPFFIKEVEEAEKIANLLKEAAEKIRQEGQSVQKEIGPGTNLFIKGPGGERQKIFKEGERFLAGKRRYSQHELIEEIKSFPERFSTNVLARPVLQSLLFPVAAYVAGPGEAAYYKQIKEYHAFHGVLTPRIVPRASATFITPAAKEMLEKCSLNPWDAIASVWSEAMPDLEAGIKEISLEWESAAKKHLFPDLSQAVVDRNVRRCLSQLKRRVVLQRLKKREIPSYSLHFLRNLIHPREKMQERVLNWWEFQRHTGENLVQELLNKIDVSFDGHLYCYL